jgi:hypothetical protein
MLAGEMFSCPAEEADATMIDDALSELLNIIAGQVKSSMGLEQTLGLPKMLESETMPMGWHSATLKHDESAVLIWVALNEPGQPGSGP